MSPLAGKVFKYAIDYFIKKLVEALIEHYPPRDHQ